ncbi:MAG TPA: HAD family hydrolase [Amnibacterium sp.]|nr:HAD family hydrolase [Amnibacterium sp.]
MNALLWDVDGTLLLNSPVAGRLYDRAVAEVTGVEPAGRRPNEHGKTDAQIITERLEDLGLGADLLPAVRERLDVLSASAYTGEAARRAAPGTAEAVAAVAAAGWRNGLLTGNSPARIRAKFASAGLDPDLFDEGLWFTGESTTVRADLARRARAAVADGTLVILGDTPSDGAAAAAAGIPFIAVATGAFDEVSLRATGAALVIPDLVTGLPDLLTALDAAGQPIRAAR